MSFLLSSLFLILYYASNPFVCSPPSCSLPSWYARWILLNLLSVCLPFSSSSSSIIVPTNQRPKRHLPPSPSSSVTQEDSINGYQTKILLFFYFFSSSAAPKVIFGRIQLSPGEIMRGGGGRKKFSLFLHRQESKAQGCRMHKMRGGKFPPTMKNHVQ